MEVEIVVILVSCLGYLAIALEHQVKVNKTASALLTGVLCWTFLIASQPSENLIGSQAYSDYAANLDVDTTQLSSGDAMASFRGFIQSELSHHLSAISEILFFLLGAMTIVELIDAHNGFKTITDRIKTKNPKTLLWIICCISFFLSSILDNLTTVIVIVSLMRKLIPEQDHRLFFCGMVVIAANAGGAWTPIGDVTTTMLWIGGQITTINIMKSLILPSLVCMLAPLIYLTFTLKDNSKPVSEASRVTSVSHVTGQPEY